MAKAKSKKDKSEKNEKDSRKYLDKFVRMGLISPVPWTYTSKGDDTVILDKKGGEVATVNSDDDAYFICELVNYFSGQIS